MRLLAWQHVISIQDGGCPSLSSTHLLLTTVRRPSEEIQAMADNKCLGLCHDVKQNTWTLSYFFRLVVRKRTDGRQSSCETTVIIPLIQAPRSVHNNQSSPRKKKRNKLKKRFPFSPRTTRRPSGWIQRDSQLSEQSPSFSLSFRAP